MNKEKMIEELQSFIKLYNQLQQDDRYTYSYGLATALVNAGYGNIREFAEYLINYVKEVQENGYEGIGELDIRDKLEQFLGE